MVKEPLFRVSSPYSPIVRSLFVYIIALAFTEAEPFMVVVSSAIILPDKVKLPLSPTVKYFVSISALLFTVAEPFMVVV